MKNNNMVKLGIYSCALLMMGAIGVASNLSNIMAAFPAVSPTTMVFYMISIPCLIVIPVTIITGKLMETIAKKTLVIIGILFWLVGGTAPFFMNNLFAIIAMRCLIGIGVGMVQTLTAALVVENFESQEERNKTMGNVAAFQMLGCIIFSLVAGYLGSIGWKVAFLVHLIAVVSLFGAILLLPHNKPVSTSGKKAKFKATPAMWIWTISFFVFMAGGQTYANSASAIITEMGLGNSVQAGYSLAIFAFIGAFLFGCALSICIPSLINGAAGSVDNESSSMAVSIATCLQNIGMALCPYIVNPLGAGIATDGGLTANQGAMIVGTIIMLIVAVFKAFGNKK